MPPLATAIDTALSPIEHNFSNPKFDILGLKFVSGKML